MQEDAGHDRRASHTDRLRRGHLAAWDRLDAGAYDFTGKPLQEREGHQVGGERAGFDGLSGKRGPLANAICGTGGEAFSLFSSA